MMRSRTLGLVLVLSFLPALGPAAAQLMPMKVGLNSFTDESVHYLGRDAGLFKKQGIHHAAAEDNPKVRRLDVRQLFDLRFFSVIKYPDLHE